MPQRSGAKNSTQATSSAARDPHRRPPDEELLTGSLAPADKRTLSIEEEIGAQVRRFRRSMDLTVAQLGMNAGISAGMLSKIENGTISPSLSTLWMRESVAVRTWSSWTLPADFIRAGL